MSKKHFIAMADAIIGFNSSSDRPFTEDQLNALARFCQSQNSNFNWSRWMSYIKGECGPSGGARHAYNSSVDGEEL